MRQAPLLAALVLFAACASSAPTTDRVEVEVQPPPAASSAVSGELTVRTSETPTSKTKPPATSTPFKPGSAAAGTPLPFPIPVPGGGSAGQPTTATLLPVPRPKDLVRISALATTEAPQMQPSGPAQSARFKQGEILRVSASLSPGMCLTAIAVSDGITELDVSIVLVPGTGPAMAGFPPMLMAVDTKTGPVAVVGGAGQCFKSPLPMPMPIDVVVTATQGQGEATVQLFTK